MKKSRWIKKVAAAALGFGLAAGAAGCAGLGMTSHELELLESSAADARFMDRSWADRSEAERREFAHANAANWGYFNDLAHGRQPASDASTVTTAEGSGK